ncbi:retrovirus-related pol polyprotein from transposon TNT 1-94 [Tanacetum coccineum]
MTESPLMDSGFAVPVFSPRDDPIACLNKAMAFLTAVASSRGDKVKVILVLGEGHMARQCTQPKRPRNAAWYKEKAMLAEAQEAEQILDEEQLAFLADPGVPDGQAVQTIIPNTTFQTEDLDTYDSDYDDIFNAQAVLMDNISNYGFDVISEVPHSATYLNDMENQCVDAMQDFEKNTIGKKMIDSQMDDMIREKLAMKEQVDSLEQNLSKQIKEKECLLQTFTVFKKESKEKEDKYMENEIDLEKKIKELNILFKVGQSAQTVRVLTKPQAFYDNIHKQALGYQNPFHLKKAQRIKQTLYDGIVMSDKHVAMPMIDDEETLILEEKSRSKMSEKAKDPEIINKNISHKPIDYEKLNRLSEDFGKHFTPQQEMDAEQAFWVRISNLTSKHSDASLVKIEAPKELPKVSLVNKILRKLKVLLARFENVVKIRTTPDARTEGEWGGGVEHTKAVFNNEIIPFLKSLKDIFNVLDRDLLNEIMEVQTVFNQMDAAVQQFSVDKQCLKIAKKELLLENDRFLQQIMSQEVLLTVMNSMSLIGEYVNMYGKKKETCNIEAELLKSQNAFNDLLKRHLQLEKHSQLQDKDSTICKLKDIIKSLREKSKDKNVKYDYCEIETKNVFKEQLDSIKKTRVLSKEQSDSLIDKMNLKSAENEDLKAQIQDKVFVITSLKNDLQKIKGKEIIDIATQIPSATTIVPGMFKLDLEPLAPRNMKNKVKAQPRKVNKKNRVVEPICDDNVKHSNSNANYDLNCANCKKSLFDDVHDKCSSKKAKIVESKNANYSEPNHTWGSNATDIPSSSSLVMTGTVRFGNDHIARIMGYGDYQLGNVTISKVYYVEGLGHNLFSVGQFCDGDLEVAFRKNTCFIRNLEGVDLLSGSCDTNLYTISLDDMLKTSLICLLSKASKTKSWLWHRRLSHLNFGTINKLAKDGLARGILRLKFQKDHLCSACALRKSKKSSHQPKAEDTNQEKLYLLHMDLCGQMRVASINGKRYILVIIDDYSRFTWVRFLRIKDEAPEAIIKCIKNIQVRLNATVRNVRTDNGTEFVNQTLREFYENVGISHQTSVAHTPQQNNVVERRNHTLVEATRTMLIFSKAPLSLWAEAINTSCYT